MIKFSTKTVVFIILEKVVGTVTKSFKTLDILIFLRKPSHSMVNKKFAKKLIDSMYWCFAVGSNYFF